MHKWAIMGTGDISGRLVPDLLAVAPGAIRAVWGRTEDRAQDFAREHGIPRATSSVDELLSHPDVDIVYIATPAHTHAGFAVRALEAGKHVLIEKPIATSEAEAERIFVEGSSRGLFVMEAMWMRFNPLHVELIHRIAGGLLGEVNSVRASFGTPFQARGRILTPAQGGSILRDRGIYPIALAQWFLGDPSEVHAAGGHVDGVDVRGHATLECEHGFAQLAWSGVEFLDLSATISGERGWITLDPMFWAGTTARVHAGSVQRIFGEPEVIEHPRTGNGYRQMIAAVMHALDSGLTEHPWHGRDDTLRLTRTMDAVLSKICAASLADSARMPSPTSPA